jgi:hypothetical protein
MLKQDDDPKSWFCIATGTCSTLRGPYGFALMVLLWVGLGILIYKAFSEVHENFDLSRDHILIDVEMACYQRGGSFVRSRANRDLAYCFGEENRVLFEIEGLAGSATDIHRSFEKVRQLFREEAMREGSL